jgi:PAS domain S-box-containing protein
MNQSKHKQTILSKCFFWPAKFFTARTRLALTLASFVAVGVFVAELFGWLPNPTIAVQQERRHQTESLALMAVSLPEDAAGMANFKATLKNTVKHNPDLLSAGLRGNNGELRIEVGPHRASWVAPSGDKNWQMITVPISRGKDTFQHLELAFKPILSVSGTLISDTTKLASLLFLVTFGSSYLFLVRMLKQLDTRGAVPQNVRDAFDTMAEGLLLINRQGAIMLANAKFGSMVGVNPVSLAGENAAMFPWRHYGVKYPWQIALESNKPVSDSKLEFVDHEKVTRTFTVSAAPVLRADGKSRGAIVTFDDITSLEQHKLELIVARKAADEANEAKSSFLSRMSHEIRTPMNAIIGFTDILQDGDLDRKEQVRYLTTIQSSGEHLLTLINDILDLSKVEAGQMTIERRSIPLVPLINQVVDTLANKASEKNLAIRVKIESKVPAVVETDDTRLRQVLINTIGNAIKFTAQGSITLVARLIVIENKTMMQFDVADTGVGMSAKALETIFDPFTQADDTITRKHGGTGLGLAISKQLSEALDGGISVVSEEGVGTTFTITIDPGQIPTDAQWVTQDIYLDQQSAAPVEIRTVRKVTSGHVLVVDDTKANRDLAGVMLKRIGVTCDFACNGREAIEQASSVDYDLILMDMNMPVMGGMEATAHLRECGFKLPILALTAMVLDEEIQKCLDSGCNGLLPKPIRQDKLVSVLAEYLEFVDQPVADDKESGAAGESAAILAGQPVEPVAVFSDDALDGQPTVSSEANHPITYELPAVLKSSLPDDPDFNSIVADFSDRLPDAMEVFVVALENQDLPLLRKRAHWLVGSAGTVGFEAFVAPARELEYIGDDFQRAIELVTHLFELGQRLENRNSSSNAVGVAQR